MSFRVPLSSINASDGNITYAQGSVLRVGASGNVNAAGSMVIGASGNVGIGTSSPVALLDLGSVVHGTPSTGVTASFWNSAGNLFGIGVSSGQLNYIAGTTSTNSHVWHSNGVERMRITATGAVGIGTTVPLQALHVAGAGSTYTRVSSSNAGTGAGDFYANATSTWLIGAGPASGGSEFQILDQTSGSNERMCITATGSVGIGTNNPVIRLQVDSGGTDEIARFDGSSVTNPYISLYRRGTRMGYWYAPGGTYVEMAAEARPLYLATTGTNPMLFLTNSLERVRIDGNGNLSVGTSTTNTNRMYVVHETAATNTVNDVLRLESRSSGTPAVGMGVGIELAAETSADNFEIGAVIEAVTTDVALNSEDFDLVFRTMTNGAAASEQARITSTGIVQDIKGDVRTLVVNAQGAGYTLQASDHGLSLIHI